MLPFIVLVTASPLVIFAMLALFLVQGGESMEALKMSLVVAILF
jgi:hypothetical protein